MRSSTVRGAGEGDEPVRTPCLADFIPVIGLTLNLMICGWALLKGFYIEPTTEALQESAEGQRMALLAVPGLVLAVIGLVRRRWALPCGVVAVLLGLGAGLIGLI